VLVVEIVLGDNQVTLACRPLRSTYNSFEQ